MTITKGMFKCAISFSYQDFTPTHKQFEETHLLEKLAEAKEKFTQYINYIGGDRLSGLTQKLFDNYG